MAIYIIDASSTPSNNREADIELIIVYSVLCAGQVVGRLGTILATGSFAHFSD